MGDLSDDFWDPVPLRGASSSGLPAAPAVLSFSSDEDWGMERPPSSAAGGKGSRKGRTALSPGDAASSGGGLADPGAPVDHPVDDAHAMEAIEHGAGAGDEGHSEDPMEEAIVEAPPTHHPEQTPYSSIAGYLVAIGGPTNARSFLKPAMALAEEMGIPSSRFQETLWANTKALRDACLEKESSRLLL